MPFHHPFASEADTGFSLCNGNLNPVGSASDATAGGISLVGTECH